MSSSKSKVESSKKLKSLESKVKRKTTTSKISNVVRIDKSANEVDWLSYLEPKKIEDLLLHPKKIQDIKGWLELAAKCDVVRILLLIGQPGCSKSSSIKVIGEECGYDVCEFISNSSVDGELLRDDDYRFPVYEKQTDKFADFLFKCSRYQSLFKQKERLLIVKDLPNCFLRKGNEEEFWSLLKRFKEYADSSIVFILTETNAKHSNIEYNLFPDSIRAQLGIDTINLNPISLTMMKKALKDICAKMKGCKDSGSFVEPSSEVFESIVIQSQGDIRSAILNLQLACQRGSIDIHMQTKIKTKKDTGKKQNVAKQKVKEGIGKNEILTIFHGVGRALYPKKEMNPQTNRMELTNSPEFLAESFSTQPGNFIELLHSNYLKNYSNIEDITEMAQVFSQSDVLSTEYRNADQLNFINLNMVIRGTMVLNSQNPAGFRPVSGYASKKFKNLEEKNFQQYLNYSKQHQNCHRISLNDYFIDFKSFSFLNSSDSNLNRMKEYETCNETLVIEDFD